MPKFRNYCTPSLGVLCAGLSVLFLHHGNYWSAHWASKWAILVFLFSLMFGYQTAMKTKVLFGFTTAYLLLNAASVAVWPQNMYVEIIDTLSLIALEKNALYAYLIILIILVSFVAIVRDKTYQTGAKLFLLIVPIVSVVTTLFYRKIAFIDGFYSGNPSMNGCLIAGTLPFLLRTKLMAIFSVILAFIAIYFTKASIPFGVLAVVLGAWMFSYYKLSHRTVGKMILLLIGFGFIGHLLLGEELLQNSGRFDVWGLVLDYWGTKDAWLFGTGLGTSQILVPIIQNAANTPNHPMELFLWLHNDWLQILIETGYIGFGLVIACWIFFAKKAFHKPILFSSFMGFSGMAFFNYPLRLPIHSFCLFLICCLIYQEETV